MIITHMLARIGALAAIVVLISSVGRAEPVSVDRMQVTAGDTILIDGFKTWLQGCDTPETTDAKCAVERERGELAAARMRKLLRSGAVQVQWVRRVDRYKRGLVRLYVNGQNVCRTMIEEGLAIHSAGGRRIDWCTKTQPPRAGISGHDADQ
jgi:endonuclease YncB( thermonuclease family)